MLIALMNSIYAEIDQEIALVHIDNRRDAIVKALRRYRLLIPTGEWKVKRMKLDFFADFFFYAAICGFNICSPTKLQHTFFDSSFG